MIAICTDSGITYRALILGGANLITPPPLLLRLGSVRGIVNRAISTNGRP